jgi:hypothetical protein
MATFLTFVFWRGPIFLLVAEVVATISLSRRQVKRRLLFVIASYLILVALAIAFALLPGDDLGFGIIPALLMTAPWYSLAGFATGNFLVLILLGAAINCAIFYLVDRLSYPKNSANLRPTRAAEEPPPSQ